MLQNTLLTKQKANRSVIFAHEARRGGILVHRSGSINPHLVLQTIEVTENLWLKPAVFLSIL